MIELVFVGLGDAIRAGLAAALTVPMAPDDVRVALVRHNGHELSDTALKVLDIAGLSIDGVQTIASDDRYLAAADLVIVFDSRITLPFEALPGAATVMRWDIESLAEDELDDRGAITALRERIKGRLEDFLQCGTLATLVDQKRKTEMILDHMEDGIIVHDARRVITWFNRAAEVMVDRKRDEVIGRDCHDIFENGLCGDHCAFRGETPELNRADYSLSLTAGDGQIRRLTVHVAAMHDAAGNFKGVLSRLRDVTEVSALRRRLRASGSYQGIIGTDPAMQSLYELIDDLADSDCAVLIQGPSGTGKELVAGAIHATSRRALRPLVTVNCGALPEGVLESELFGHVKGAFTGAIRDKKGRFQLAHGGTIFLDEVGELTQAMQIRLLRVLQSGTFEPVGSEKTTTVDVRVISATNRDLQAMVRSGAFREDLYYRLAVVPMTLPSLGDRRCDIPLLAEHFVRHLAGNRDGRITGLSDTAMAMLVDYPWPGNVRQLQNAIQYGFVKCKNGLLAPEHLPPEILAFKGSRQVTLRSDQGGRDAGKSATPARPGRPTTLTARAVEAALQQADGNKVQAAKLLGVGPGNAVSIFEKYKSLIFNEVRLVKISDSTGIVWKKSTGPIIP